ARAPYRSAASSTATKTVYVVNTAPTLTISGPAAVDEGVYTLTLSSADPGDYTIRRWEISWGDGVVQSYLGNPSAVTHVYDGDGRYLIIARATDEDGTFSANSLDVAVANLDPTITRFALLTANPTENGGVVLQVTATDPAGRLDPLTFAWDF